jgi:hypothetical protein
MGRMSSNKNADIVIFTGSRYIQRGERMRKVQEKSNSVQKGISSKIKTITIKGKSVHNHLSSEFFLDMVYIVSTLC